MSDIDTLVEQMEKANDSAYDNAMKYAEARSQFEYLDEMRKTVLAELCRANVDQPVNHREIFARSSEQYKTHLGAIRESRLEMLIAEAKMHRFNNEFEMYRSKLSAIKTVTRF